MSKISTLTDFVSDHVASNFSVRPDTLDTIANKVRLAVVELQKDNLFPESTIVFDSIDMKEEKRDSSDELIFNFYELPKDFRQMYSNGPAFEVDEDGGYTYIEYGRFIKNLSRNKERGGKFFTIQTFNGDFGKRHRFIPVPFPEDDDEVRITYYSNGVDMPIENIDEEYYMPVINHVLHQMGLIDQRPYSSDVIKTKRGRQNPAGQGSHHKSFTKTVSRYFGNHRKDIRTKRRR